MPVDKPILIPQVDLLMGPKMEKHTLLSLSQVPKDKVQSLITNPSGESGIAGAVGNKLIPLVTF